MSKLGNTALDTGAGAAAGSVIPGVGTVAGAALGAGYGIVTNYLSGDGGVGTSGGDMTTGPRSNFSYGNQGPLSAGANQAAGAANQMGAGYAQQGQGYFNGAWGAQDRSARQIQANPQDRNFQLAALGGTQANAAALQNMGMAPQGPSVAAAQLQQGQDAAMQQSLALARSGRSLGGGASALQQAQFANAGTEQATNQQAAIARLQEQQQYHQFQLGALGAAQSGFGQAGGLAGQLNASDVGLQAQNAGLSLQQQQANNQTTATMGGLGQGVAQLGLGEQQLGNQVLTTQLGAGEQYQNSIEGHDIAQQGLNNQQTGMALGAISGGAARAASDRDVKQNIMPAGGVPDQWGNTFGPGGNTPSANYSAAPVQTAYGLTPQQQQSQLSAMRGADAGAQFQARVGQPMLQRAQQQAMEYGSPAAANGQSNYGYPSAPNSAPQPTQTTPAPTPAPTPPAVPMGSFGHSSGTQAGWGGGRANAFTASDVRNKKDIKPADADEGWLSRMLWHGGLGIKGGGGEFWGDGKGGNPAAEQPGSPDFDQARAQAAGADQANQREYQLAQQARALGAIDQGQRMGADIGAAQHDSRARSYLQNLAASAPPAPSTWGGEQTPIAPAVAPGFAFTPQTPNVGGLDAAYAAQNPGFTASDAHSKTRIAELEGQLAALRAPQSQPTGGQVTIAPTPAGAPYPGDVQPPAPAPQQPPIDLRPARGYSYEYKDPSRFGQGRFYGPMAQDLEKTPAGASTVKRSPDGTKMVDTSRLSLVNTAAISDLQKQVAALGGQPQRVARAGAY